MDYDRFNDDMSNRPATPDEPYRETVPSDLDPAYEGAGDYNDFAAEDIPGTPANVPAVTAEPEPAPTPEPVPTPPKTRTLAGGAWAFLIIGALLLIVLLVFILQNQASVELTLFAWTFQFPAGIGFLLAAITGALITALVGGVRMFEYRHQIKKLRKGR